MRPESGAALWRAKSRGSMVAKYHGARCAVLSGSSGPTEMLATNRQQPRTAYGAPVRAPDYSYLSATIGSRLAARRAGQMPKNSPTAALNTKARRMASGEISVFQCARRDSTMAPPEPRITPIMPPSRHNTSASTRNWNRMLNRVAPSALRTPISRVRSVTDTSMMFMIARPPTSRLTAARTAPGRTVDGGVHAAGHDRVVVYGDVVGRCAHHVRVDVLVALLHLQVVAQLGHDRAHVARVVRERRVVVHGEAHAVAAGDAAHEALTRVQAQQRRPERLNAVLDGFLGPRAKGDHGDHGAHADDDAQHGEERPELVGPQRLERDLDNLAQQHRYLGAPLVSTSTVSFSARPAVTSM